MKVLAISALVNALAATGLEYSCISGILPLRVNRIYAGCTV